MKAVTYNPSAKMVMVENPGITVEGLYGKLVERFSQRDMTPVVQAEPLVPLSLAVVAGGDVRRAAHHEECILKLPEDHDNKSERRSAPWDGSSSTTAHSQASLSVASVAFSIRLCLYTLF